MDIFNLIDNCALCSSQMGRSLGMLVSGKSVSPSFLITILQHRTNWLRRPLPRVQVQRFRVWLLTYKYRRQHPKLLREDGIEVRILTRIRRSIGW